MITDEICSRPEYFFTLIKNDEGYLAIGSRKITQLDIATNFTDLIKTTSMFDPHSNFVHAPTEYNVNGVVGGFIIVQGPTRLAALGQLLDALDEEQRREEEEARQAASYMDEELVRKITKWRKQQAKKKAKEREYDPDDEWDF